MTDATKSEERAAPRVGPGLAFDVVAAITFVVVGYRMKIDGLPTDGLWFDDSWVAAGAALGSPSNLMSTGSGHPGFTAVLMAIHQVDPDIRPLAYPALLAALLGPPALYALLRRSDHGRAPSALLAAALTVAAIPALYAGRVKGYTLDLLLVMVVAAAVPIAASRRWTPRIAAAWVVAALVVGTFSGYLLLATAMATLVVVLHPEGDRRLRLIALGVQGAIQAVYLRVAQTKTDLAGIEEVMEVAYDGHMEWSWNPVRMADQVRDHLFRVMEVYPGDPRSVLTLLAIAALAGLAVGAVRGRTRTETLTARYLGLLVAVAAVGSLLDRFPFGPSNEHPLSAGGRHTLWMVSAIAFGLSVVLDRGRSLAAHVDRLALKAVDVVLVVLAVGTLVAGYEVVPPYPVGGTEPATRMIEDELRPDDLVLVLTVSTYSYGYSSRFADGVELTPHLQVGFVPAYDDDRIVTVGSWSEHPDIEPELLEQLTEGRERVWVVTAGRLSGPALTLVEEALVPRGWVATDRSIDWATVQLWTRP